MSTNRNDVRKRIAFAGDVYDALQLLARDRMATLQDLVDEAVTDLLHKHRRPVTVSDMLAASAQKVGAANYCKQRLKSG